MRQIKNTDTARKQSRWGADPMAVEDALRQALFRCRARNSRATDVHMKKMYRVFGADPYPQHFERVTEDVLRRNLVAVVGDSVYGTKKQQKVRARRRHRIVEDAIRKFRNIKQLAAGIGGYKIVIRYDPYNVGNGLGVYILALPLPERFKSKLKPKPKPPDLSLIHI